MASSAAQYQAAFNDTTFDGQVAVFQTTDTVYKRSELDSANQSTFHRRPFTVLGWFIKSAANGDILDANGNVADGSVAASVATGGGASNTAPEYPYFYVIQDDANPSITETIHETGLLDLAGANSVRDANDWT